MRRAVVIATTLLFSLSASTYWADAATKKPTPKPSVKVTAKASAKTTSKATLKASATSTSSTKASAPAKKKVVVKKRTPRKKIRVTPSPKPVWPPAGFSQSGEVYAKVPTSKELVGIISAKASLQSAVKDCTSVVCGAVTVAAETGCTWWEVTSKVLGKDNEVLGNLSTIGGASTAQEIKTILLISPEPLETNGRISGISVTCHHEDKGADVPSVSYKKA